MFTTLQVGGTIKPSGQAPTVITSITDNTHMTVDDTIGYLDVPYLSIKKPKLTVNGDIHCDKIYASGIVDPPCVDFTSNSLASATAVVRRDVKETNGNADLFFYTAKTQMVYYVPGLGKYYAIEAHEIVGPSEEEIASAVEVISSGRIPSTQTNAPSIKRQPTSATPNH
jgi:hypothetical protein